MGGKPFNLKVNGLAIQSRLDLGYEMQNTNPRAESFEANDIARVVEYETLQTFFLPPAVRALWQRRCVLLVLVDWT